MPGFDAHAVLAAESSKGPPHDHEQEDDRLRLMRFAPPSARGSVGRFDVYELWQLECFAAGG